MRLIPLTDQSLAKRVNQSEQHDQKDNQIQPRCGSTAQKVKRNHEQDKDDDECNRPDTGAQRPRGQRLASGGSKNRAEDPGLMLARLMSVGIDVR